MCIDLSDCSLGLTKVCTENPVDSSQKMTEVCPGTVSNGTSRTTEEQTCSCLSVLTVEQALSEGISPLGHHYEGCVYLEYELVFPDLDGMLSNYL